MRDFMAMLRTQRFDDYRYYHQSRINQTLHLISAIIFLGCYALLFSDAALAGLVGWLAMLTRQIGHFFFEPNGYDAVNNATNEYKEDIKIGYNQRRKIVLLIVWGMAPVTLFCFPTLFGIFSPPAGRFDFIRHAGARLAGHRHRWRPVPDDRAVNHQGCADRPGVGHQGSHRSVPQHRALLQVAARTMRGELIDPAIGTAQWDDEEAEEAPYAT